MVSDRLVSPWPDDDDEGAPGSLRPEPEMVVNDRPIALKKRADGIAWFEFAALCEGPRPAADKAPGRRDSKGSL